MKKVIALLAFALTPAVASAQSSSSGNLIGLISDFGRILNMLIPILVTLAVIFFFWGLVKYLAGGAEDKDAAKNIMIWGVIALFVMLSIFGIIRFIGNSIGITPGQNPGVNIPQIPR